MIDCTYTLLLLSFNSHFFPFHTDKPLISIKNSRESWKIQKRKKQNQILVLLFKNNMNRVAFPQQEYNEKSSEK